MTSLDKNFVIAIDGGAATGKSVLAKGIAKKLNILYIDTGAMYRATAYYFISKNIEMTDENIKANLDLIEIKLKYVNGETIVFLNNEYITDKIRTEEISMGASNVSKNKYVREKLVELQRQMAGDENVVLEGRDVTTVVFPDATLKIFLTASIDIRALRRKRDLEKKGKEVNIEEVKEALIKRDLQDSTRKESPLKKAEDAVEIDTTDLTNDSTVDRVIELLKERID